MTKRRWEYTPSRNRHLDRSLYAVPGQPCFFTIRCYPGAAPFVRNHLAALAIDCLLQQREKTPCEVVAYCLMPDHLHVVVEPQETGISCLLFVDRFKGWSSRILHQVGWQGKIWQPRNYDHLIRRDESLEQIVAYILANPVRAGLCDDPDNYPWSGIPDRLWPGGPAS